MATSTNPADYRTPAVGDVCAFYSEIQQEYDPPEARTEFLCNESGPNHDEADLDRLEQEGRIGPED
jgi:hypothetical protein